MKKKNLFVLSLFTMIIICACSITVSAYTFSTQRNSYNDSKYYITGYSLEEGEDFDGTLVFSNKYDVVSGIYSFAFQDDAQIKTVIIDCDIYEGAFYNCKNLETVVLGPKVKHIKAGAFYGCSSLKQINIPEGAYIDRLAFEGCSSLTNIIIGNNAHIASNVFGVTPSSLTNSHIYIPEGASYTTYETEDSNEYCSFDKVIQPATMHKYKKTQTISKDKITLNTERTIDTILLFIFHLIS